MPSQITRVLGRYCKIFQKLIQVWEGIVNRLPLVKTIYTAIKDIIGYFSPDQQDRFSKVVMVKMPGHDFQILGFVTRDNFDDIPLNPEADDPVAVYMPMSYQIGGYTLYLSRSCLTPIDMPFELTLRVAEDNEAWRRLWNWLLDEGGNESGVDSPTGTGSDASQASEDAGDST